MDKRALGKARVASLDALLRDLLGQDGATLRQTFNGDLFKKNGSFHLGQLEQSIGQDCECRLQGASGGVKGQGCLVVRLVWQTGQDAYTIESLLTKMAASPLMLDLNDLSALFIDEAFMVDLSLMYRRPTLCRNPLCWGRQCNLS